MITSERRLLYGIVMLAFFIRLVVALLWQPPIVGDGADYLRLARGLSAGTGYVDARGRATAWRPPGYPVFLAVVERTGGTDRVPLALAQAAIGAAVVATTWVVARGLGGAAALLAAALVALDAGQIALAARTLSEGLFTLLSLGVVALSLAFVRRLRSREPAWGWAVGAGALAGAATLTRGVFVGYPVALAAGVVVSGWWGARGSADRAGGRDRLVRSVVVAAVLVAAYGAVLLPWAARNSRALGALVPVATQGGLTLYASWFPPGGTTFGILPQDEVTAGAAGLTEVEQSAYFTDRTVAGVLADPLRVPRLVLLKLVYFWVPLDWELLPTPGMVNPTYLFVLLWALIGFLVAREGLRLSEHWPLWLPVVYTLAMALVFYGSPRMRAPVEPLLTLAAAGGLVAWHQTRGARAAIFALTVSAAAVAAVSILVAPLKGLALGVLRGVGIWRS